MATYETPVRHEDHYIERDTGSNAGIWAVIAVLIVLFALLFFGTRFFGRGNSGDTGTNINGSINIPSGGGTGGTTGGTGAQ